MSTLSTGRGAHAGQAPLLNPETIEVTPAAHDLEHWAHARAQAERLDLAGVLDRLGVAHLTDVPLEVLAAHPDDETLGLGVVAQAVVAALAEVRALAGPAGLAFDPDLGHALDDLGLYVAQLNCDAESTRLGAALHGRS
jgi:hypothetical protein